MEPHYQDERVCPNCKKSLPVSAFYSHRKRACKPCYRHREYLYRQTEGYKAVLKRYRARPEVKARILAEQKARRDRPEVREALRKRARAPEQKAKEARRQAERRLLRAHDPAHRARLAATVAACEAEIARIAVAKKWAPEARP